MKKILARTTAILVLVFILAIGFTGTVTAIHDDVWDAIPEHSTIVWDLDDDGMMYKVPHGTLSGTVSLTTGGETYIWKTDEAASGTISFPAAYWYGYLDGSGTCRVWVGSANDIGTFTPSDANDYATISLPMVFIINMANQR